MIYLFSLIAGRHRSVMWLFLTLRWLGLAAIGSPLITLSFIAYIYGVHPIILLVSVLAHLGLLFGTERYSRHRRILLLKRRWPVLWAQVQRRQLLDMDDGHLNRPWMAAPKLGLFYKTNGKAASLAVCPAVGQTLVDLQNQAVAIAAQTDLVDSFEVDFIKASSHRGNLKIMFTDDLQRTRTNPKKDHNYA